MLFYRYKMIIGRNNPLGLYNNVKVYNKHVKHIFSVRGICAFVQM